jgi:hypothetical protein
MDVSLIATVCVPQSKGSKPAPKRTTDNHTHRQRGETLFIPCIKGKATVYFRGARKHNGGPEGMRRREAKDGHAGHLSCCPAPAATPGLDRMKG